MLKQLFNMFAMNQKSGAGFGGRLRKSGDFYRTQGHNSGNFKRNQRVERKASRRKKMKASAR